MKTALSLIVVVSSTIAGLYTEMGIYKEMFFAIGILGVFCVFAFLNESAPDNKSIES